MKRIGIQITKIYITPCFKAADVDGGEAAATIESTVSNARHALGDSDAGEACAVIERIASNGCHPLGDGDTGEACAVRERIVSNGCHALGDGDAGEACAFIERIVSNGCHALGDISYGQISSGSDQHIVLDNHPIDLLFFGIEYSTPIRSVGTFTVVDEVASQK